MQKRVEVATWVLLVLVTLGIVVPPIVICIMQPETEEKVEIQTNGTLPLDVFFLLDASRSLSTANWNHAVDFASNMGLRLQDNLTNFRAGMGQFATEYSVIHPLSGNLSAWGKNGGSIKREKGNTGLAYGLCGNDVKLPSPADSDEPVSCKGGASGELMNSELEMNTSGLDCGITEAVRMIIVVTDGVPANSVLTVAAAKEVKNSNTTIVGILIQGMNKDRDANIKELYALSSCCPAGEMRAAPGRWGQMRPQCTADVEANCTNLVTRTDFAALGDSVDHLVEGLQREMVCSGTVYNIRKHADWGVLWFLLLLAPAVLFLCWQNLLLCLSKGQEFAEEIRTSVFHGREVEMSSTLSAMMEELERASEAGIRIADPPEAPPDNGPADDTTLEGPRFSGEGPRPSGEGPRPSGEGPRLSASGEGPRPSGEFPRPSVEGGGGIAEEGPEEGEPGAGPGLPPVSTRGAPTGSAGRKVKRWAPVRTAYIVCGQRMNVDYGHGGAQLPPSAQLASHRGMDDYYATQDGREVPRMYSDPDGNDVPGTESSVRSVATQRIPRTLTRRLDRQMTQNLGLNVTGVPEERVAPHLRKFNVSVLIPLLLTLILVPIVIVKSGILKLLGFKDDD